MHKVFVFLTAVSLLSGVCGLEVLAEGGGRFVMPKPLEDEYRLRKYGQAEFACAGLLTCSQDKSAIVWDAKTAATYGHMVLWDSVNGRIIRNFRGTYSESRLNGISPDGRNLWSRSVPGRRRFNS